MVPSEKAMTPHSSTLAWKIPWTEEPGRLQSMGSPRVGYDWATSLSLFTFMHWRRKWQTTPVFLSGETQGWGSLVGCHLWGRTRVGHDWSDLAAAAVPVHLWQHCVISLRSTVMGKKPHLSSWTVIRKDLGLAVRRLPILPRLPCASTAPRPHKRA